METDKILEMYASFAAQMFANFTGYEYVVNNIIAEHVTISFFNSPLYRDFFAEVSFQEPLSVEHQIMRAFDHRCDVTKYEV